MVANNENIFFGRFLLSHFRSVLKGNTKLTPLSFILYHWHKAFFYKLLMDTQAIGKANNDTVLFSFKSTVTEQVVCSKTSFTEENHSL